MNRNPLPYDLYSSLARRMGEKIVSRRLRMQAEISATGFCKAFGKGGGHVHLENLDSFVNFVDLVLRLSGMRGWGRRNSLDFRVEENEVLIPALPREFDGFRILQLTDLHIDGFIDGGKKFFDMIAPLRCDLCVLTGDYRLLTFHSHKPSAIGMSRLITQINAAHGVYAILGNHDFLEQVPALEESGVRVLLNEGGIIKHNGAELFLAGVDDPHFYGTHDLERAFRSRPLGIPTILLSHSPELYAEASALSVDFYLCGHTHGGQICLPGGIPVMTHAACPRYMAAGRWNYGNMSGYTSRGAGCSGVQARFNCPPEITIHTLRSKGSGS
ncbi:metallophosphoesterase [Desulfovibrio sp. JC010]|uniref:metallophosphoesterase n=1 Tax=Desulfovibrio sp. JC010 TaxID=2593641 RepID=UPI0013D2A34D|nr:metallophosphoesterase [Desulfovibrio sp. JC010]NDV26037.1 metallophosphoesterase [Desulfovibrio sp. JC010]